MTAEELRERFFYDPEHGGWTRLYKPRTGRQWLHAGSIAGNGYMQLKVGGKVYAQHRLAWLYMTGEWPVGEIDHINGDKQDNRWKNLRCVSSSANKQNARRPRANNASGFLGVTYDGKRDKYAAQIYVARKHIHLGYHDTPQEAFDAYLVAKRVMHAGCTL